MANQWLKEYKKKIEYVFDKANDYERIKEKTNRRNIRIQTRIQLYNKWNFNEVLKTTKTFIRFLRENTPYIINTFNKSGTRNLRILKHSLNDFKKFMKW